MHSLRHGRKISLVLCSGILKLLYIFLPAYYNILTAPMPLLFMSERILEITKEKAEVDFVVPPQDRMTSFEGNDGIIYYHKCTPDGQVYEAVSTVLNQLLGDHVVYNKLPYTLPIGENADRIP